VASVLGKLRHVRNCWTALLAAAIVVHAQTDWQTAAGGEKQFDAASVKLETEFRLHWRKYNYCNMPRVAVDAVSPTNGANHV
jgi:hypothetical protein